MEGSGERDDLFSMLLFLQGVLALSPTAAGAVCTALSACLPIGAALTTVIVSRRKRYQTTIIIGMTLMTIRSFLITRMTEHTCLVIIGLSLALFGLGAGSFFAVQVVAAQNALPQAHLGVGTGVIRYLGQLGPTLGAAVVGMVVNSALQASLPKNTAACLTLAGALQHRFLVVLVLAFFLKDVSMTQPSSEASEQASNEEQSTYLWSDHSMYSSRSSLMQAGVLVK